MAERESLEMWLQHPLSFLLAEASLRCSLQWPRMQNAWGIQRMVCWKICSELLRGVPKRQAAHLSRNFWSGQRWWGMGTTQRTIGSNSKEAWCNCHCDRLIKDFFFFITFKYLILWQRTTGCLHFLLIILIVCRTICLQRFLFIAVNNYKMALVIQHPSSSNCFWQFVLDILVKHFGKYLKLYSRNW